MATQDSLPAAGQLCRAGLVTRWVPSQSFRALYISFPLPRLLPGALKTVGGLRKTRYRGLEKVDFVGYLVGAAYNLVRLARIVATPTPP